MWVELDEREAARFEAARFEADRVHDALGLQSLGVGSRRLQGCRVAAANLVGE